VEAAAGRDRNSRDRTRAIAENAGARELRIQLITDLPKGGCAYNRNQGITHARRDFLAFLDSDDIGLPEKLHAIWPSWFNKLCP
jgi:teichuronic acid biosynthesis glycosyltransferase TuaG